MILSGLPPWIILDIANRAIAFWAYQVQQQQLYMECKAQSLEQKLKVCEAKFKMLQNQLACNNVYYIYYSAHNSADSNSQLYNTTTNNNHRNEEPYSVLVIYHILCILDLQATKANRIRCINEISIYKLH